jgi:CobQ-like glutamine amidotransferase family enzyme
LVHLFPDLLNVYGDSGNVAALVARARARSIRVDVEEVVAGRRWVPTADILLIGGGQDREQILVARELDRLGRAIGDQIEDGASLLAVCGGYQCLGWSYRSSDGAEIEGPGILDITTGAGRSRLVGPVVATLTEPAQFDRVSTEPRRDVRVRSTIVGFENHSGRTELGATMTGLATIEVGNGNNGLDGSEGILRRPGDDGVQGMRIGTYLHGPLLPRNPHVADALIAAALARGGPVVTLAPVESTAEWSAHDRSVSRIRRRRRAEARIPRWQHRIVDPPRSLIGF